MFKFFLTNSFFRLVPIITLGLFVLLFLYAYEMEKQNDSKTMTTAPFANSIGEPNIAKQRGQGESPLLQQRLASREIAKILDDMIPETLNFNKSNFEANKKAVSVYFTDGAYEQYLKFLESSTLAPMVLTQDLQSGVFIEQQPLEVSSGIYNGAYKWLFEVPATINFNPRDVRTYRGVETSSLSHRVLLRVQFTRVENPNNPSAIKIEIWQAATPRS